MTTDVTCPIEARIFNAAGLVVPARTITTARHLTLCSTWLWVGILAFATMAFESRLAQAAVTEAWVQRYSNVQSNATAQAVKVACDAAGNITVTGSTGSRGLKIQTIKYSGADGAVLWRQRHNNPLGDDDRPSGLAVDGSGNVIVTGNSDIGGIAPVYSGYTAKYAAADGALLWEKHGNGTANRLDAIRAVAVDDSGNVVVAGSSLPGVGTEVFTAKYRAADGALLWEKRYGSGHLTAAAVDANGNVAVAGYFSGYYTAKYAATDGALIWEKRYNGPATNSSDCAEAVAVDSHGNVVVTGYSSGTNSMTDYYTAKYGAADGTLLWEQRYNGPANSHDFARAVAVDGNDNVVVTGSSDGANSSTGCYTAKYAAADGAVIWEKRSNSSAGGLAVDVSGNVVVTGSSYTTRGFDYSTVKYAAADGGLLWEKRYDGPAGGYDEASAVAVDGSGNVVVTGTTDVNPAFQWSSGNYYTAKYAAEVGALLWEQSYDSAPYDASPRAVAVDGSGNVVVTGSATAYYIDSFFNSSNDYYTAKYAAENGALVWEKRYNGPANRDDFTQAMAVDGTGNVVVTGFSYDGTNNNYTAKYAASDGAVLWEKRSSHGGNAMAVDGSGNVVITGYSSGTNAISDAYTAKYAAANGTLLWEKRGPSGGASALAVDGGGNAAVTGYSYNGTDYVIYTAKYAAEDGALLWEKRYELDGCCNFAKALAVDGSGNVVVAGTSYTAKYAAADGALLWEKRYNGSPNDSIGAAALAVDSGGNVVVTGTSVRVVDSFGTSTSDYYTAKYAAADGALLWERRYNGPVDSYDEATGVAVDDSGNVVVTGISVGSDSHADYYTAKYAAADGALLWEKRFKGSAFTGVTSHYLALGPDAMVAVAGTVNGGFATVVYREVPEVVSIDLASTGVRLRFSGISDHTYNIERAPAVTGPWNTINTQAAPSSGLFEYLDTDPPAQAAFYRAREP